MSEQRFITSLSKSNRRKNTTSRIRKAPLLKLLRVICSSSLTPDAKTKHLPAICQQMLVQGLIDFEQLKTELEKRSDKKIKGIKNKILASVEDPTTTNNQIELSNSSDSFFNRKGTTLSPSNVTQLPPAKRPRNWQI